MIDEGNVRTTKAAREGGATLGMDFESMIAVVKTLTTTDFYKSMTTYTDHRMFDLQHRWVKFS